MKLGLSISRAQRSGFLFMRIRTIKPEFFSHEGLFEMELETKLPIRVAFAGLWCACDREGRFKWEPRRLGVLITPYDNLDFSRVLDALLTRGILVKYRVGEAWFGAIPSWEKHQIINNKERASQIPGIDEASEVYNASVTREPRVDDACRKEGKGREGKGRIAPKERERDALIDELAKIECPDLSQVPPAAWSRFAKAKSEIMAACPDLTCEEIQRRLKEYRAKYSDISITAMGLASHWGEFPPSAKSRWQHGIAYVE